MPAMNVSRSIEIAADCPTVFERLRDFSTWPEWSPWILADPKTQLTYSDNPRDVGGGYGWDSDIVGAGTMEHEQLSAPGDGGPSGTIHSQLRFTRPWKSEAKVRFIVDPAQGSDGKQHARVRWEMDSSLPIFMFFWRGMMESMIGMDYDRGLKMVKELIEDGKIRSETQLNANASVGERTIVGATGHSKLQEIGPEMDRVMTKVKDALERAGIGTDGEWVSTYDKMKMKTQDVSFTSGMVVPASTPTPAGLVSKVLPACSAIHVTHTGSYDHLGNAWFTAYQTKQATKQKTSKVPAFEVYDNSPNDVPPEELVTHVYLPLK